MPDKKREITSYKYEFRSTESENVALLYLKADNQFISMAAFVDSDDPLPPPKESVTGWIAVAYRYNWFHDVIDMLRSEKPVFFTWSKESKIARITTEEEPIGEEEPHRLLSFLFG